MRKAASSHSGDRSSGDLSSAAAAILLRAGLFIALASLLSSIACRKRASAVIGFARAGSIVQQVAQEEVRSWAVEIRFMEISRPEDASQGLEDDIERASALVKLPDLVAVVGHDDSRSSLLAAPIYNEAGIPHIIPTATSRQLKESGEWTFMLAPDEEAEAAFISSFVADYLRAQTVTVFYQTDEYGTGLRNAIVAALDTRGIRIIDQVSFDWMGNYPRLENREVFDSIIEASLRRGTPDAIIIAGRSQEAGQIARLVHKRAPAVMFVAGDGVEPVGQFLSVAGQAADSFYIATFWSAELTDETSRAFVERFRRIAGRDPLPSEAMKHDAAMTLAQAAREAGTSREAVRKYLAELGLSRPAGRGVTGEISFAPGRPVRLIMTRISGGKAIPVSLNGGK
jgi:branched-chain amino acid transport system substrate-binding protein